MTKNKLTQPVVNQPADAPTKQITIDGIAYSLDELTKTAKQQLVNVRAVDAEMASLQRQRAIAGVARAAYVRAVAGAMPKEVTAPNDGARSAVIDGVSHDWASLGERVQGLLSGIRAADQELARINGLVQMAQVARSTFANAVQKNLPKKTTEAEKV
jgi:hypothetical protein